MLLQCIAFCDVRQKFLSIIDADVRNIIAFVKETHFLPPIITFLSDCHLFLY